MYPWPWNPYPAPDFWFGWPALEEEHAMSADAPEQATQAPTDKGQLFTLATKPRHQWGPQYHLSPAESLSGHEQFEWHCAACHLVRLTVCPEGKDARREYRWGGANEQFEAQREPVCVPVVTEAKG